MKLLKELHGQRMIEETLQEVERLVDFAMDVVDMAEERLDPGKLY